MFFQSKKKRLWRARVLQTATHHANQQQYLPEQQQQQQSQQIQLSRHFHPRRYYPVSIQKPSIERYSEENSVKSDYLHSTLLLEKNGQNVIDGQENIAKRCCYISGGNEMNCYDNDRIASSVVTSTPASSRTTELNLSPTSSVAATAANVLLNCCGGSSSGNTYSSSCTNLNANSSLTSNNNNNESLNYLKLNEEKQMFRGLMSRLKESQLTILCQAVEKTNTQDGGRNHHQPECVLIPRGTILGEEPNVIACRLWRWPDIKGSDELKSIPSCPSEKDRVYVCCNPSHWSRLCTPGNIIALTYICI